MKANNLGSMNISEEYTAKGAQRKYLIGNHRNAVASRN